MNDFTQFGHNLRQLLSGVLAESRSPIAAPVGDVSVGIRWARKLDKNHLPEIFADSEAQPQQRAFPKSAVYHVMIKTVDTFSIPGKGPVTVELEGYSQVVVSGPSSGAWGEDVLYVNYTEHKMFGSHPDFGNIAVSLNPSVLSGGNIFPSPQNVVTGQRDMACRVNIAALFNIEKLGVTLFNKTPVQIASDRLERVPPLFEGGAAHVFSLPLYRLDDPDGELVAYIEALDYRVQGFAPRQVVESFRSSRTKREFLETLRRKDGSPS